MIPVAPQPEPPDFDATIRRKGLRWLAEQGVDLDSPAPERFEFKDLWRRCLDDLYESYGRVCAYAGFHIERVTGSPSVEHFVPKKKRPDLAYEWRNYRLVCGLMNGRKSDYEDVLDPFTLEPETFHLNLVSGAIFVNPGLDESARRAAQATIDRLKLDDAECRKTRQEHYWQYREYAWPADYLRRVSPFVWFEAGRQGLL
jgi:uncharacterized protein (TIGR02646 family)